MKTHWKYIVVSLLIGGFLGSALTLFAWQCYRQGGMNGKGPGQMRQKFYQELQLSQEQKAKVDSIMQASRKKIDDLRRASRLEIRKLLTAEQQITFDKLDAKMEARRQKRMERFGSK